MAHLLWQKIWWVVWIWTLVIAASAHAAESTFRAGFIGQPLSLDPTLIDTTVEFNLAIQMFEGLTTFNPEDLTPQPGIAASWDVSADGRTYTFHLRNHVSWSDGAPITAATFKYSWLRALQPETDAVYAYLLYYIKNAQAYHEGRAPADAVGLQALDPATFVVTLETPTPFFLQLTTLPIYAPAPEHVISRYGPQWAMVDTMVVNGPYRATAWQEHAYLRLERNPAYWDATAQGPASIMVYFFLDSDAAFQKYQQGELDWLSGLMSSKIKEVINSPEAVRFPILATYYYSLNVTHPGLADLRVRKALSLALNRSSICRDLLTGGELPAFGFIPPRIPEYPYYQGERENPALARRLLSEAGYPDGKGFPTLSILFNNYLEHELIATAAQRMWKKELNIEVRLDEQERKVYRDKMLNLDYDIARSFWVGDYAEPSTFLDLFEYRTSGNNRIGWSHPAYTKFLQTAKQEPNRQQRYDFYHEAEQILIDEAPIIPIYHSISIYLLKPYIKGIYPNLMDLHPFKDVTLKKE
jgi:oligopeptide transport system substrate-binding protein